MKHLCYKTTSLQRPLLYVYTETSPSLLCSTSVYAVVHCVLKPCTLTMVCGSHCLSASLLVGQALKSPEGGIFGSLTEAAKKFYLTKVRM